MSSPIWYIHVFSHCVGRDPINFICMHRLKIFREILPHSETLTLLDLQTWERMRLWYGSGPRKFGAMVSSFSLIGGHLFSRLSDVINAIESSNTVE